MRSARTPIAAAQPSLLGRRGVHLGDLFGLTAEDFFADDPRLAFQRFAGALGRSPNQCTGFQSLFPTAQSQFQTQQANTLAQGVFPTTTFSNFLQDDFPFLREFLSRSPTSRGDSSARRLAPSTTFGFAG